VTATVADDLGRPVAVPATVRRVVSLVPSLTEALAASAPGLLAGATDWCTHPAGLDVARVRGTKNPDVARIRALAPDLVLANQEENRRVDVETLEAAGVPVWVTDVRTLDGAFTALERALAVCGVEAPGWLLEARTAWDGVRVPAVRRCAVVPVWRRPWMAVGPDTFTGSLLARLGVDNALDGAPGVEAGRYPHIDVDALPPHDLVVLPDEPYPFGPDDGPEAFAGTPTVLVPGRLITWYGPSLVEAARALPGLLRVAG
jgi:ABC-type Fe3+-hydroxamate transport system substrate-binding protein